MNQAAHRLERAYNFLGNAYLAQFGEHNSLLISLFRFLMLLLPNNEILIWSIKKKLINNFCVLIV